MVAAKKAVTAPITVTTTKATLEYSKSGELRAIKNTPAVTIVAAWINADTGVGPYGISLLVYNYGSRIVLLQTGNLYHYAFMMLIGTTCIFTLCFFQTFAIYSLGNYVVVTTIVCLLATIKVLPVR